jgi:hypothetical protein
MTALVAALVLAALLFALAALVRPAVFYLTVWSRLTTICVDLGIYDSGRQAERASHTTGGHRTASPSRGSTWPSLKTRGGLPAWYWVVGRIVQDPDRLDLLVAQFGHYTGRPWTWQRLPRSRRIKVIQARPLPDTPTPPAAPVAVMPHVLPVGETRTGPALWDVTVAYHRLTVARTGWRKTSHATWLRGYAAAVRSWDVVTVDPEDDSPETWAAKLRQVAAELDRRPPGQVPASRVLVQIDEFDEVMRPAARTARDHAVRVEVHDLVWKLLRHGGKRGIHLDAYAQDPRAKALGGDVRSKFGARVAGALEHGEVPLVLDRPVPRALRGAGRGWWLMAAGYQPEETVFHTTPIQQAPRVLRVVTGR